MVFILSISVLGDVGSQVANYKPYFYSGWEKLSVFRVMCQLIILGTSIQPNRYKILFTELFEFCAGIGLIYIAHLNIKTTKNQDTGFNV